MRCRKKKKLSKQCGGEGSGKAQFKITLVKGLGSAIRKTKLVREQSRAD